ncbi:MAG: tRNA (adenosine(37)-N6)-dimethylallyltransferase MiaA [Christensenellales bacterium]
MSGRRFIVITGPTASGKSQVSIEYAKAKKVPVISADSMQIYRGLDIGTAKITPRQTRGVTHYLIDITEPNTAYTAADFKRDAFDKIKMCNAKGQTPVVCGGTGLYINSLVYSLNFGNTAPDRGLRQKYTQLADDKSIEYLYNELKQKDPEYANLISRRDTRRIIRRLELIESGGWEKYDFLKPNENDSFLIIGLTMPRDMLYERINARVDEMIKRGLEAEARTLFEKYGDSNALKAIGYKEFYAYFEGKATLDETAAIIKRNTRRYAKRQITWFKRDSRIMWFNICRFSCLEELVYGIITYTDGKGF